MASRKAAKPLTGRLPAPGAPKARKTATQVFSTVRVDRLLAEVEKDLSTFVDWMRLSGTSSEAAGSMLRVFDKQLGRLREARIFLKKL